MRAMVLPRIVSLSETDSPLELVDLPVPQPGAGEIRIRVAACGVCHTELDEIEGRIPPPKLPVVVGHEVVGYIAMLGEGVAGLSTGQRVGVGWIHSSSGDRHENLLPEFKATGRDVNGGYAECMTAPEKYAYPIPSEFSDPEAAPLLCAGAVGYRAL
jgi:alcohol dehydrogenase, propanol-preferring